MAAQPSVAAATPSSNVNLKMQKMMIQDSKSIGTCQTVMSLLYGSGPGLDISNFFGIGLFGGLVDQDVGLSNLVENPSIALMIMMGVRGEAAGVVCGVWCVSIYPNG